MLTVFLSQSTVTVVLSAIGTSEAGSTFTCFVASSKRKLHCKLQLARSVCNAADDAGAAIADGAIRVRGRDRRTWHSQHHVIKDVEGFGTELQPLRFGDKEILYQREIHIDESHGSQIADRRVTEAVSGADLQR